MVTVAAYELYFEINFRKLFLHEIPGVEAQSNPTRETYPIFLSNTAG